MSTTTLPAIPSVARIQLGDLEVIDWADKTLTIEYWEKQYESEQHSRRPARLSTEQAEKLEAFLRPLVA